MTINRIIAGIFMGMLLACSTENSADNQVEMGESKAVQALPVCDCEDLIEHEPGVFFLAGEAFTGACLIYYQNSDAKYIEKQLLDGKVNGKVIYYDKSGAVLYEENYVQGDYQIDLNKEKLHCNCKTLTKETINGQTKHFYKGQLFTGTCSDQYPDSEQDYVISTYANGLLNGFRTYYGKDGAVLYQEKYKSDTLIQVISPQ